MARARCSLQAGADPSKAQGRARALKLLSEYRIGQGWTNTTRNDRKLYSREWSRPGILQRGPRSKTRNLQHGWLVQPIIKRQDAVPELLHRSVSGQVLLPRTSCAYTRTCELAREGGPSGLLQTNCSDTVKHLSIRDASSIPQRLFATFIWFVKRKTRVHNKIRCSEHAYKRTGGRINSGKRSSGN